MGFLKKLFSGGGSSKENLVRNLAKRRLREDPLAESMDLSEDMIDTLETMALMGLPEATIATIVETYALSQQSGASDKAIIDHIESHRSQMGSGALPTPLNLESYIKYRIHIEHSNGAPISEQFISDAIATCRDHYGCRNS